MLQDVLTDFLKCELYYTIGWVNTTTGGMFHQTEESLRSMLVNGVGSSVNLHAWLTLPSMEIIDASLPTSLAIVQNLPRGRGAVLAKHPSRLTGGIEYRPMLVGGEFLVRIGALRIIMEEQP